MTELLDFLLYAFIGYVCMRIVLYFTLQYLYRKNEDLKQQLVDLAGKFIFVKPEKHGDTIYLFDAHTDQFIAQGKTVSELKERCLQRFPDKNVVISNDYVNQFQEELKDLTS